MSTPLGPILSMWEAEGNRHASAFDACAGAVVIGERPSTAAEVALGIARVQARRRRVAVADTVGELGPLEDLVPMDAPYGLIDSFFYGVSLNKIAYTVDPARNLIIFPSGAVPIDHEALLGSDRWIKLLEGFRAADGLLLIVAPAESSALSSLIEVMDGVVLVGNVAAAPGTRVLAHARLPVIPARPTPSSVMPVHETRPAPAPPAPAPPAPAPPVAPPVAADAQDAAPPAPYRQPWASKTPTPLSQPAVPPAPVEPKREPVVAASPPAAPPPAPVVQPSLPPVPPRPSFHDWAGASAIVAEADSAYEVARDDVASSTNADRSGFDDRIDEDSGVEPPLPRDEHPLTGAHVIIPGSEGNPELVPPWARDEEFTGPTIVPGAAKTVTFWVACVAGALIAAALLTWISTSMMSRNNSPDSFAARPDTLHPAAQIVAAPAPTALKATTPPAHDSASAASSAPAAAAAAATPVAVSAPSPYSVVLADVSSLTGANGEIDQAASRGLPVVTFAPYTKADGSLSYIVLAGASADSAGADSLLRVVRAKRFRNANAAHVVQLPYAVLIQKGVSQDQASMFVRAYLSKGPPVYPLLQADGSASLYAGGFRGIEQAQPLVTSFRANGDQPTVTIRTGRPF